MTNPTTAPAGQDLKHGFSEESAQLLACHELSNRSLKKSEETDEGRERRILKEMIQLGIEQAFNIGREVGKYEIYQALEKSKEKKEEYRNLINRAKDILKGVIQYPDPPQ